MNSLNLCALIGTLARPPIAVTADDKTLARFTLRCDELGKDGVNYRLFVPCEAYGQVPAQVLKLPAGAVLAIEGRLKWRSYTDRAGQKQSDLAVLAREVRELLPGAEHVTPAAEAVAVG